jgi:hypothetical protein
VQHFREEEVLPPLFTRRRAATGPAVVSVLVEHVDIARYALDADVPAPEAAARGAGRRTRRGGLPGRLCGYLSEIEVVPGRVPEPGPGSAV